MIVYRGRTGMKFLVSVILRKSLNEENCHILIVRQNRVEILIVHNLGLRNFKKCKFKTTKAIPIINKKTDKCKNVTILLRISEILDESS